MVVTTAIRTPAEIAGNASVNLRHRGEQICVNGKAGTRVGPARGCEQSRTDAVPGHIAKHNHEAAVGHNVPVVKIAAGVVGRLVPAGDGEPGKVRRLLRKQRPLDVAGGP